MRATMTRAIDEPTALLGGLSPAAFMRRHWQRRPLHVRQALPGIAAPLTRTALFALAARDGVEARLVTREGERWTLRHGPLPRRALPPLARPGWTLLVQGVDTWVERAHALRHRFAFVPQARLDDLMVSYASDGGGVGPHVDSYDVFLIQVHGRRRWRWGPPGEAALRPGLPLKILARFEPTHEAVCEPGDLLYLPPGWGHDGVAEGACMTCSVGFRAPRRDELARELLQRIAEGVADDARLYRDPQQPATPTPGELPAALREQARQLVQRALQDPGVIDTALGEWLSEPKPQVWFEPGGRWQRGQPLRLDRRTRMLYDARHVYLNGEACRAGGRDARLLRALADRGRLDAAQAAALSAQAAAQVAGWVACGWLHADHGNTGDDDGR
jgi:50S ribosomal protein L16 3-hydroxylase